MRDNFIMGGGVPLIIEQIDENKIKVTVDTDEQREFGVTYESMNYSDANTRRLCERIMSKANKEIGFKIGNAKLMVEARQSCNGNVTLYLSRIQAKPDRERLFEGSICFNDANALMDACDIFKYYIPVLKSSSLYYYQNKYYMFFEVIQTRKEADLIWRTLLEYGDRIPYGKLYIQEHGECICEEGLIERTIGINPIHSI